MDHHTQTSEKHNIIDIFDPETGTLIKSSPEALKNSFFKGPEKTPVNVVYKVVYPDDLKLKHPFPQKIKKPVGRPKKIKTDEPPANEYFVEPDTVKVKVVSKTRCGREVKVPKYIQDEFEKIDIKDPIANSSHVPTATLNLENAKSDKSANHYVDSKVNQMKLLEQSDVLQKKRRIAAQYRCPKCKKAYLGRNKMLEHLRKNPSHGPIDQNREKHFEVWNHLVSVTQKCPLSERGNKFCQELSNLLHNLLLLTNALFKKLGNPVNEVEVDKVLGNAIGLNPGTYYFDDTNLYKDVSVLKLLGNAEFVNSIKSTIKEVSNTASGSPNDNCNCSKLNLIDELVLNSMLISSEANDAIAQKINDIKIDKNHQGQEANVVPNERVAKQFTGEEFLVSSSENLSSYDYDMKSAIDEGEILGTETFLSLSERKGISQIQLSEYEPVVSKNAFFSSDSLSDFKTEQFTTYPIHNSDKGSVNEEKPSKIKIHANIMVCPPKSKYLQSHITTTKSLEESFNHLERNKEQVNPDLLIENSVLSPLGNLRPSVDELMLSVPVTSGPTNILDTSSSSDEVMNVDHFVNERFHKITDSDLEGYSNNSLSLDLPSLDLFQFHTS